MYSLVILFFLHYSPPPRYLHSFPTRRSSDLFLAPAFSGAGAGRGTDWSTIAFQLPSPCFFQITRPRACDVITFLPCVELTDRKSTRLNSSHVSISYAVFCLKKKNYQLLHDCL